MMLSPCWPNAGPTGGAGFACPPGIWSLISVTTVFIFLAIYASILYFAYLKEIELHRCASAEYLDFYAQPSLLRIHLFHNAAEIVKGTVNHLHMLAHGKIDYRGDLLFGLLLAHLVEQGAYLLPGQRLRLFLSVSAHEISYSR